MCSKINNIRILLVSIFFVLAYSLSGQELSTTSSRAIRHFEEANRNYNLMYYDLAENDLLKALKADAQFIEAMMLLADVYKKQDKPQAAMPLYQLVIQEDADKYPEVHFFLGVLKFNDENYSGALNQFEAFLRKDKTTGKRSQDAHYYKASAEFSMDALKHPVAFSPVNLGAGINSSGDEYINAISSDEQVLFFTGRQTGASGSGDDFFVSQRNSTDLPWPEAQRLGAPVNTPGEEGALTITPDGRYILFAGCQWPDGYGSCDIYAASRSGSTFSAPANLGPAINTSAWESQPTLSSDGRTLYFASNRSGGYGKSDIWQSFLLDDGEWSQPQNLGATINTAGAEMSPFIHPDGQTLYFASNRHPGMGGLDLFMTRKDDNGNWSEPVNLGFPINTSGDEINIVINTRGDKAYISSERYGGFGGFDIFEFELYEKIRPFAVTYIKGVISDAKTQQPLHAYFSLIELATGIEVVSAVSDKSTGSFLVCVPAHKNYALNVSSKGYLFYSDNISISEIHSDIEPKIVRIQMQPVEKGRKIVLRNIFFETDQYEIEPESEVELKKILQFLIQNPSVKIEISGHTDNVGTSEHNLMLSKNRAKAVYDYLIQQGIRPDRLTYQGYGFSRPHADNTSEIGRAANRRTEIEILDFMLE